MCLPVGGEGALHQEARFAAIFFTVRRAAQPPSRTESEMVMANILVSIEKGIEIGAEDALKWIAGAGRGIKAAPAVIAALGTLVGALEKPLGELAAAAANPLNLTLDVQTARDLKTVWPEVRQFLTTLGVKF